MQNTPSHTLKKSYSPCLCGILIITLILIIIPQSIFTIWGASIYTPTFTKRTCSEDVGVSDISKACHLEKDGYFNCSFLMDCYKGSTTSTSTHVECRDGRGEIVPAYRPSVGRDRSGWFLVNVFFGGDLPHRCQVGFNYVMN
eukprot:TRINITY_DN11783_c0_g1_i1.p1 TRINITY_DN11783_c0_g1~~TRINITY_DN11783_c0_g1_i1.p1  ORF type:complete len:157 (-),score=21.34 TRINITY_DN11783_c0_g1_i1:40-465(-)